MGQKKSKGESGILLMLAEVFLLAKLTSLLTGTVTDSIVFCFSIHAHCRVINLWCYSFREFLINSCGIVHVFVRTFHQNARKVLVCLKTNLLERRTFIFSLKYTISMIFECQNLDFMIPTWETSGG